MRNGEEEGEAEPNLRFQPRHAHVLLSGVAISCKERKEGGGVARAGSEEGS